MALIDQVTSHWRMDEASGTEPDVHGSEDFLELGSVGSMAGKLGNARTFDGNGNNHLFIIDNATVETGDITFSLCGWVNFNTTHDEQFVIGKWTDNQTSNQEYRLRLLTGPARLVFGVLQNGSTEVEVSVSGLSSGAWHFVAIAHDHSSNKVLISLNGSILTSTSCPTGPATGGAGLTAGGNLDGENPGNIPLDGTLDSWTFFKNYALSDEDVSTLFNGGDGLDYPFDGAPPPTPDDPPTRRRSQRVDPLPNFDYREYQQKRPWFPVEYIPTVPPLLRNEAKYHPLPEYDHLWYQHRRPRLPEGHIPDAPPPRRTEARYQPPPVYDHLWYQQRRPWAPVADTPETPPLKRAETRYYPAQEVEASWYNQRRPIPVPSGILTAHLGVSGIYLAVLGANLGVSGVRNDIGGYNVYVGVDALPDLDAAPAAFSAALPVNVATTPPASGTRTYYVIVRKQNQFGLESQNQYARTVTIDSSGNLLRHPLAPPQGLQLSPQLQGVVRVLATYPGWYVDEFLATHWNIWVSESEPVIGVDTPAAQVTVNANVMVAEVGTFLSGVTYQVAVALFRSSDSAMSDPVRGEVTFPTVPGDIDPVRSGYEDP